MPKRTSNYQFFQEASLSQKLADKDSDYVQLAGADPAISKKIQRLKWMVKHGLITEEFAEPIIELLDGDRKAAFATSDKVNEITKMGMQMPKKEDLISKFHEDE